MKKALCFLVSAAIISTLCSCGAFLPAGREFLKAPEVVFTTKAEDNGYGQTYMYVDGTAGEVFLSEKDIEVCDIQTDDGRIAMLRMPLITSAKEWKKLKENEFLRVKFMYLGYSDVLDEASGALVSIEEIN